MSGRTDRQTDMEADGSERLQNRSAIINRFCVILSGEPTLPQPPFSSFTSRTDFLYFPECLFPPASAKQTMSGDDATINQSAVGEQS